MSKDRVKELEEELRMYKESPYVAGYLSILKQINTWNKDLSDEPTSLKFDPANGDADQKAFEKAHKFILTVDTMYEQLDKLRSKMNPKQAKELEEKEKEAKIKQKDSTVVL